jgi:phosphohistidine phosphatase SixA
MRLIVMRHAKSSWKSGVSEDHQRPLNKRGRRDAPRVAQELAELGWSPQVVLSSDSQRTRETWDLMSPSLAPRTVSFLPQLYLAGIEQVRAACVGLADDVGTVLVLGHNPGWEDAARWLSGEEVRMTTANAALLEHEGDSWSSALGEPGSWSLRRLLRPKEL